MNHARALNDNGLLAVGLINLGSVVLAGRLAEGDLKLAAKYYTEVANAAVVAQLTLRQ